MVNENEDVVFDYDEPIEGAKSNVIEKGRYKFRVIDIKSHISHAGNKCADLELELEGNNKYLKTLVQEGKMKYLWHNFLFAIGIRSKGTNVSIPKSRIVYDEKRDKEWQGFIDIGIKVRTMDDGSNQDENKILNFSPIDKPIAPISDVPPETEIKEKPNAKSIEEENTENL